MPDENKWQKVPDDSIIRCQAVIPSRGQCNNMQMEGSDYCPAHGGNRGNAALKLQKKRMYDVERFQAKLNQMEDHEGIKSLKSEIAILRMVLEQRLQQCHDTTDLMLHSQSISSLVAHIEKLVTSTQRLDMQLSNMLDATQAVHWMGEIVDIISHHVTDEAVLSEISGEILESFDRIQKEGK